MLSRNRASVTFAKFIKVNRFLTLTAGLDILDPEYRFNFVTFIVILFVTLFYVFSLNTICQLWSQDSTVLLDVFSTMGCVTTGVAKITSALKYQKLYRERLTSLERIYVTYQDRGPRYEAALQKCCSRIKVFLYIVCSAYLQLIVFVMGVPLSIYLLTGKKYMVLLVILPGIDVNTEFGYWTTFVFHTICLFIAGFGLFAGDMFIIINLRHSRLYVEILKLLIEDLNEVLSEKESDEETEKLLIEMIEWHQSYFRFADQCNYIFNWIISVQVGCASISIATTLFVIYTKDWPGAYAYLLYGFNALYEYCILGTDTEICNDDFCTEIYNIHWYKLTISQQKIVRLMLMRAQSPKTINIAGVLPLSVSTALQITRSIYSFFMMMIQFY